MNFSEVPPQTVFRRKNLTQMATHRKPSNMFRILNHIAIISLACVTAWAVIFSKSATAADKEKIVVPFDFVSDFDGGRYGRQIGDMLWKKLDRRGGFVIPETMIDVRDTVTANNITVSPHDPLEKVRRIVKDDFGGDVAVWGSVERVAGGDWDVYDLKIRCVDFSAVPRPVVIYSCDVRTKTVGEIPHVYLKAMLDKLYGEGPAAAAQKNPLAEKNWAEGENLVEGGDFQSGAGRVPAGWESRGGQLREPLGDLVRWTPEAGDPANRVIRFTFDKALGDTFGVMYYSKPFPVEEDALYRFECRYRTNGPAVKVFIKCYAAMDSKYLSGDKPSAPSGSANSRGHIHGPNAYVPEASAQRECYRSQHNLDGPKNVWNTHTQDFTPRHSKYTPTTGRVMLYAYLGAGTVEFDDVVVKQLVPPPPDASRKQRRHSIESGVTVEQMRRQK